MVMISKIELNYVRGTFGGYDSIPKPLKKKEWIEQRLKSRAPKQTERLITKGEAIRRSIRIHAFPNHDVGESAARSAATCRYVEEKTDEIRTNVFSFPQYLT